MGAAPKPLADVHPNLCADSTKNCTEAVSGRQLPNFYRFTSERRQQSVFIIIFRLPGDCLIKYLVKASASELNGSFGEVILIY